MEYKIIDNVLSPEKCKELIDLSESIGYDEADIRYDSGAKMNKEYRDNSRCLHNDEALRLELEQLILPLSQDIIADSEERKKRKFIRLSGKFRFYRYGPQEKFKKHRDANELDEGGISLYTVLFYLNDAEEGGATGMYPLSSRFEKTFCEAKTGRALIFDHSMAHTGEELLKGVKYVLRTDFVYEFTQPEF